MRILVIEDEKKVASFVQRGLEAEHYAVDVVHDGESGLARAVDRCYDLVILDVMLPKRDGYAVLRELRGRDWTLPVLLLTARSAVADRVLGLDLGADDYLTKPFEFAELLARVRALLRRGSATPAMLSLADLTLDPAAREVARAGRRIELTAREYALLEFRRRTRFGGRRPRWFGSASTADSGSVVQRPQRRANRPGLGCSRQGGCARRPVVSRQQPRAGNLASADLPAHMPSNRQLPSPSALQTSSPGDGPDDALGKVGRFTEMTSLPVLIIVGVLATASPAPATCGWFGTQLQCDVGSSRVVIGTQAAEESTHASSLPIRSFHGDGGFPDDHAASRRAFEIELQDFRADPSLCRKIGNETYCY